MDIKNHEIREGNVYQSGGRIRRIIAVHGDAVAYSKGSEHNGMCKVKTFKRWLRSATLTYDALSSHERDPMQYGGGDCEHEHHT